MIRGCQWITRGIDTGIADMHVFKQFEYVNRWFGSINTNWSLSGNWTSGLVLQDGGFLEFAEDAVNDLIIDGTSHAVSGITNTTDHIIRIKNGGVLKVLESINEESDSSVGNDVNNSNKNEEDNSDEDDGGFIVGPGDWDDGSEQLRSPKNLNGSITLKNAGNLVVETGGNALSGAFIYPQNELVDATVEFTILSKTPADATKASEFNWQFFGCPFVSLRASSFNNSYVRQYDEGYSENGEGVRRYWSSLNSSSILEPFRGYEIARKEPYSSNYSLQGTLVNENVVYELSHTSDIEEHGYPGQHVLANPYLAALPITNNMFGSGLDQVVYFFNAGSYTQWIGHETTGNDAGQYTAVPARQAEAMDMGYIPSMQGFVITTKPGSNDEDRTFVFDYSTVNKNTVQMRSSRVKPEKAFTKIDLLSDDVVKDCMWLFSDLESTRGYDEGYDGYKMIFNGANSQLYAMEHDGAYQVNTVPDINNTILFFKAEEGIESYTLNFSNTNMNTHYQTMYLVDLKTNIETEIIDGGSYKFMAANIKEAEKRFQIRTERTESEMTTYLIELYQYNNNIALYNGYDKEVSVNFYTVSGELLVHYNLSSLSQMIIPENIFTSGIYLVKVDNNYFNKIVIK